MRLSVKTDITEAVKMLDGLGKEQVPFATAYALTQTSKAAQREVEREVPRVFDRPTPYSLRGFYTKPATKRRLSSEVGIKDGTPAAGISRSAGGKPVKALGHHTTGEPRPRKPFENLLQARNLMPRGWYAIPGRDVTLDQYGNVPPGLLNRVLSQLQAHSIVNNDRNESASSKGRQYRSRTKRLQRYFVVMPGDPRNARLVPGIWERTSFGFGSSIRPLFIYVKSTPRYRRRLDFNGIVERTVSAQIRFQFRRGMQIAKATAR